jgi:hypothetical protein
MDDYYSPQRQADHDETGLAETSKRAHIIGAEIQPPGNQPSYTPQQIQARCQDPELTEPSVVPVSHGQYVEIGAETFVWVDE